MNGPDRLPLRAALLAELLARPAGMAAACDPNRSLLASILSGHATGQGCLPPHLGMGDAPHARMLANYFPGPTPPATERSAPAIPELDDLHRLLLDYRAGERESECWIADIVALACAGADHLWQDLGLDCRDELSQLMQLNFPALARANTGDMKWKKFLYHQLCSREGIYVCPAPSCGECKDYIKCFGPEN